MQCGRAALAQRCCGAAGTGGSGGGWLPVCLGPGSADDPLTGIQVAVHPGVGSRALALLGHIAQPPCAAGREERCRVAQLAIMQRCLS